MSAPTPLLDFFKKGEVPRDVRVLASQGGLETRAHEQLAILALLVDDPDDEIRAAAEATLNRIPAESLRKFLGRSDVSIGLREFFADRGVFPDEIPAIDADDPLVSAEGAAEENEAAEGEEEADRDTVAQRIAKMGFTQRLKAAVKGTREMRAMLVRDPNKMIAAAVLSSPKITEQEVESIAKMTSVSDDVLRIIGNNRAWTKNYSVVVGLVKNPKTPVAMSMNMMQRLNDRDLSQLSLDRNVPEALRVAARKRVSSGGRDRG
ncbi:MAG TPA: hypothetical protein VH497_10935 [Vicinamibacterales bacterium]